MSFSPTHTKNGSPPPHPTTTQQTFNKTHTLFVSVIWFAAFAGQGTRYTFGWVGFAIINTLLIISALIIFRKHIQKSVKNIPTPLTLFIIWCGISVIWSQYKMETLLGVTIQISTAIIGVVLASALGWKMILNTLSYSLKSILILSIIIELYVSLITKNPLMPFVDGVEGYPWVEGNLLIGGPIQGLVGNRNLLGFIALLSLCIFIIEWTNKFKQIQAPLWGVVAILVMFATKSATVTVALIILVLLSIFILIMRICILRLHKWVYYISAGATLVALTGVVTYSSTLLSLVGRDVDLTGRTIIWGNVLQLVEERPFLGWGWVSYWAPWVPPFDDLAILDGTRFLQAHNALLDVLFQTGIVGGLLATATALLGSVRSWRIAVNPEKTITSVVKKIPYQTALPALLIAALLIQSLSESRLLLEGNWLLFVLICCKAKKDAPAYGSFKIVGAKKI